MGIWRGMVSGFEGGGVWEVGEIEVWSMLGVFVIGVARGWGECGIGCGYCGCW